MKTFDKLTQNILVTGGAGFIGSCLIRRLLNKTEFKIFNLDKISYASDLSSINNLISIDESLKTRYRLIKADLNNYAAINNAIEISNPDIIFHLAAESHVDRSIDSPRIFLESNVNGTFNLLEATKNYWENLSNEKRKIFRFHHISTDEVFGSLDDISRFSEDTKYSPRSPYSASKAASDHFVNAWHHTYNLPIIITNCSNNYGPWQFPEKLIPLTIQKCLKKKEFLFMEMG